MSGKEEVKEDLDLEFTDMLGPKVLFGTTTGTLGFLMNINEKQFFILERMQDAISSVIKGIGGFRYALRCASLNFMFYQPIYLFCCFLDFFKLYALCSCFHDEAFCFIKS